jgi:hypothetical protein
LIHQALIRRIVFFGRNELRPYEFVFIPYRGLIYHAHY